MRASFTYPEKIRILSETQNYHNHEFVKNIMAANPLEK